MTVACVTPVSTSGSARKNHTTQKEFTQVDHLGDLCRKAVLSYSFFRHSLSENL